MQSKAKYIRIRPNFQKHVKAKSRIQKTRLFIEILIIKNSF